MLILNLLFAFVVFSLLTFHKCIQNEERKKFNLAGIFYEDQINLQCVFNLIIDKFASNDTNDNVFEAVTEIIPRGQVINAQEKLCSLTKLGVFGLVDTTTGKTSAHIQSLCDSMEIPHLITQLNDQQGKNWSVVNMYPSPMAYNAILQTLIKLKKWFTFSILYVKGYSLSRVSDLLKLNNPFEPYVVSAWELSGDDFRPVFAEVKKSGDVNYLIDCPAELITQVLKQAQQVGLMSDEHSYIFTSTDLHTIDLDPFKHGGANITGFRIVDPLDDNVKEFYKEYNKICLDNADQDGGVEKISTQVLLTYDAVSIYVEALSKIRTTPRPISCSDDDSWNMGSSVINVMRTSSIYGLTRNITFDSMGERSGPTFDIYELTPAGLQVVSTFKDHKIIDQRPFTMEPKLEESESSTRNKTFLVLISLTQPFAFIKESVVELEGNDRYEGFAVDLIDELSKLLGFNYILEKEDITGVLVDGRWTGMIGKLINDKADFAITDITITSTRVNAVDFTEPFMNLGISILYKKPSKQPPEMFSFMAAFSREVWIWMFVSQIALGFVTIFIGRLSHKEWHNPIPCVATPETLENQFSLANAIWLIIGSVMQQGSEIAPIAVAPRMLTSVWWFFTMVMISSYTGTLVSFLIAESKNTPFNNAEDLAKHRGIMYGAKSGGATLDFFKSSNNKNYVYMYQQMIKNKWTTGSNVEGRNRALNENYAFFMESTSIEYEIERFCELMQVGGLLDAKSYGIAMKKNSPYRADMSSAIQTLKETGTIQNLKNKWWKEKRGGGACVGADDADEVNQLEMKNVIGAFVVLGIGSLIGIVIGFLDMCWGSFKRSIKYQTNYKDELIWELKFAFTSSSNTKPVKRRQSILAERYSMPSLNHQRTVSGARSPASSLRSSRSQSVARARHRRYS